MIAWLLIGSIFLVPFLFYYVKTLLGNRKEKELIDYLNWKKIRVKTSAIRVVKSDYYEDINNGERPNAAFWIMTTGQEHQSRNLIIQTYLTTRLGDDILQSQPIKIDSFTLEILLKQRNEIIVHYRDKHNCYFDVESLYK
ncbi:hypothetical protein IQ13_0896 [Lacibacter cauensis]|uniref:Uncharacterized protein n=1 Tax=Lacibacter cauensis TaxID=510947 RepID=A0A562SWV7_9BACT|nr:hypothetical protein IQ13_0896 [Lacibacter cauensis]